MEQVDQDRNHCADALKENVQPLRANIGFPSAKQLVMKRIQHKSFVREWDFCDQCIFYISCLKPERRRGDGCEIFYPYPYTNFTDTEIEAKSWRFVFG